MSDIANGLSKLTSEIETRIVEDKKLLTASPFLDMLFQLQSTWENFSDNLSVLDRELAERAASLEKAHARLHQFNEIWRATLQSAKVGSPTALA